MSNADAVIVIVIVGFIWLLLSIMLMGCYRPPKWPKYPKLNIKKRLEKDKAIRREQEAIAQKLATEEARRQERRQRRAQRDRESLVSLSVR